MQPIICDACRQPTPAHDIVNYGSMEGGYRLDTLGPAVGVEAVLSLLALRDGLITGGLNLRARDPALHAAYLSENRRAPLQRVLSNSFGFGGSNASLVLGAA